jgi:glutathione reductase (NADPH)
MIKKGINIQTQNDVTSIKKVGKGFEVSFKNGTRRETSCVMYATGRVPYVQGLGLDTVDVELGSKGEIKVDAYSQTSVDNIYAVGDVTDRSQLTPIAIREGAAFAETVFNNTPLAVDHSNIPTAVFSQPPVGTVGMTEEEARDNKFDVDIYKSVFRPMKHTLSGRDEKTLMKLVVDRKTDKVLGLHIVGPDSGEMIQAFGIAVKMGATKSQFDATVAVHPTAAEELVTMKQPVS